MTQADTAVEAAIRERLLAAFPDHGLVGEEYGTEAGEASVRWYIDPIDGTHNFMRGVPVFATLLAVERDGELQAAVALRAGPRRALVGAPGWGSVGPDRRQRRPSGASRVSGIGALADAQVLYGSTVDLRTSGRAPGFEALLGEVWRERGLGDFWGYALLAEGSAEAMIEVGLKPWDAAAPVLLVEEAGGRVTDFDGRRTIHTDTFLATNGHLHDVRPRAADRSRPGLNGPLGPSTAGRPAGWAGRGRRPCWAGTEVSMQSTSYPDLDRRRRGPHPHRPR